eukprot:3454986-Prymnesium_polylepis.1
MDFKSDTPQAVARELVADLGIEDSAETLRDIVQQIESLKLRLAKEEEAAWAAAAAAAVAASERQAAAAAMATAAAAAAQAVVTGVIVGDEPVQGAILTQRP